MGRRRREGLRSCHKAARAVSGAPSLWWEQGDKHGFGAVGAGPADRDPGAGLAHQDPWLGTSDEVL